MVEQTSASDRYKAARRALAIHDEEINTPYAIDSALHVSIELAEALRALITPPGVSETEGQIATCIVGDSGLTFSVDRNVTMNKDELYPIVERAVRAGIQAAHETWEPEVALRPTQEQMLRWLGIEHYRGATPKAEDVLTQDQIDAGETVGTMIYITEQYIEQED